MSNNKAVIFVEYLKTLFQLNSPPDDDEDGAVLPITHITQLFNAILRLKYFPAQYKITEVILIQKLPSDIVLPIISRLIEKVLAKRMMNIVMEKYLIREYQFGFLRQ